MWHTLRAELTQTKDQCDSQFYFTMPGFPGRRGGTKFAHREIDL